MLKFRPTSPLGIVLTLAGVALALSPEARKAVRRAMVVGTAGVLDVVDQFKSRGSEFASTPPLTSSTRAASEPHEMVSPEQRGDGKWEQQMDIELAGDRYVLKSVEDESVNHESKSH